MYKKVINSQKEMLAWSWVLHYLHYLHGPPVEEAGPTCVLLPWLRSPWNAKNFLDFMHAWRNISFWTFYDWPKIRKFEWDKTMHQHKCVYGKRITFHTDKTISFYPEKICNSSASHCYFGLKSNFLFAILTQSSTILHFEARVTWWLCCFLQLSL